MKYKLLLVGKNRIIMDDFFNVMSEEFDCVTTSFRTKDILNHIQFFQPHALVYCITPESRDDFPKLSAALAEVNREELDVVLIGDRELCGEFKQLNPKMVNLTLLKPITASVIKQKIIEYFEEKKSRKEAAEEEKILLEANNTDEMKHILVIDDDPIMLRLIKSELKEHYNVATAISGKIGLNFLQRKKTDLILLDYEMPEENGPAVFEKIRSNRELKHIPVVFLTGISDREKIKRVISMKPQGYLLKPIEHDKLLETIRRVIG